MGAVLSQFPGEKEFYSIGEVGRITGVKPYILRYWESEFTALRPVRRPSGQRRFTRRDVELVSRLRDLLYEKRYTLEGAKKHLRGEARRGPAQLTLELAENPAAIETLKWIKREIAEMLEDIKRTPVEN